MIVALARSISRLEFDARAATGGGACTLLVAAILEDDAYTPLDPRQPTAGPRDDRLRVVANTEIEHHL